MADLLVNRCKMMTGRKVLIVMSGKGGVGKSACSAQIAMTLALQGLQVGLLDVDLCGPSVARMFNSVNAEVKQGPSGWIPVQVHPNLEIMSIGFLLPNPDDAIVWRGPKKNAMIKQFVQNVAWNPAMTHLIIDTPPGTSDEHLSLLEHFAADEKQGEVSCVLVTTPQLVAISDVERQIDFCKQGKLKISGLIENMSGWECPECGHCTALFSQGGGKLLAEKHGLPFWGKIPMDPALAEMLESNQITNITDVYAKTGLYPIFTKMLQENYRQGEKTADKIEKRIQGNLF